MNQPEMPKNEYAEAMVLGACMLYPSSVEVVKHILQPEHFYIKKNKDIYSAVMEMHKASQPIDLLTLSEKMSGAGGLTSNKGQVSYLYELTNYVASAANIEAHCLIIKEHHLRRTELANAMRFIQDINEGTDIFEAITKHQKERDKTQETLIPSKASNIGNVDAMTPIVKAMESDELMGVTTGYDDMNDVFSGWQKSDLIILGARSGVGKTSLMLCHALAAAKNGNPVGIISLEMSAVQLKQRFFAIAAGISAKRQRNGNLSNEEFHTLLEVNAHFEDLPVFIDEEALDLHSVLNTMHRMVRDDGVQLIFIDYLQLIATGEKHGNRNNEIGVVTRSLKLTAKKLNVPVIVGSQLSRAQKGTVPPLPQLSDLRDSGNIEQDADIVYFIHRPEYYMQDEREAGTLPEELRGLAILNIAKHRSGDTPILKKRWIARYTRFKDWSEFEEEIPPMPDNKNLPNGDDSGDIPF